MNQTVTLASGRDISVLSGHPWIFRSAIAKTSADIPAGSIVDVLKHDGSFLARGYYNGKAHIAVRVLTMMQSEHIDLHFLKQRLQEAMALRQRAIDFKKTNAFRLVNAEGDFLPGLIVDVYGDIVVVQFQTAGIEALREQVLDALEDAMQPKGIFERSDVSVREHEGLSKKTGLVRGEPPSEKLTIKEHGLSFYADVVNGEKTGFFLDQREQRERIGRYVEGKTVLDLFAYTGSFGVYAANADAKKVTVIDQSKDSVSLAEKNFTLNKIKASEHEFVAGDVFSLLPYYAKEQRNYDVIFCDPPSLAIGGVKAYSDLAFQVMRLFLSDGFLLFTSRSHHLSFETLTSLLRATATKMKRRLQILETHGQPADHPASAHFLEGNYLKCVLCRVI